MSYKNVSECIAADRMKWPRGGQVAGVALIVAMLLLSGCDVGTNERDGVYEDCIRHATNGTPKACADAAYELHPEKKP